MIGKLQRVSLREVWKHEAYDFTTWLQENLDILNEILDLNLSSAEREQSAGTLNVDLVAEDESGDHSWLRLLSAATEKRCPYDELPAIDIPQATRR